MSNIHLVTGYAGKEHITSADQGSFNAAMIGNGEYVLDRGNKFKTSVLSNNIVRIYDGDILMQGRHIRLQEETYVDLFFENGQQGMYRNDLVVVRYSKDEATEFEKAELVVIQGESVSDSPVDPEYITGDIIGECALVSDMPLYRVPIVGIGLQTPVALFKEIPTWSNLKTKAIEETTAALETTIKEYSDKATAEYERIEAEIAAASQETTAINLMAHSSTGVASADGIHGIRFYNNSLEAKVGEKWVKAGLQMKEVNSAIETAFGVAFGGDY